MATTEEYLARYAAAVQPHVDEPVLAVGTLCRPGAVGNALTYQVSGLWALLRERKGRQASGGLPRNVIVAVTRTRLVAMEYRPKGFDITIKRVVAEWSRDGLVVAADAPGTMSQRLRFSWPDGTTVALDALRGVGRHADLNAPFLAAVGAVVAA